MDGIFELTIFLRNAIASYAREGTLSKKSPDGQPATTSLIQIGVAQVDKAARRLV